MKKNRNLIDCCLIACLSSSAVLAEENAVIPDNWSVSGYANLAASARNGKSTAIDLDDLSIFVSGKVNAWLNPFLEAEAYSMPLWEESRGLRFDRADLVIERLYNDFELNDSNSLRVGKFLAPINHWNVVHAAPLVWTVNRPLTSSYAMANYVTGVSARHDFDLMSGHAVEFYWQPQDEFSPKTLSSHPRHYNSIIGGRWTLHEGLDGYYGIAAQRAAVKNSDETRTTVSADANWQFAAFELESQVSLTLLGTAQPTVRDKEWGGYLQMVAPVFDHFYAVGRYEHFEFSSSSKAMDSGLAGMVYRPKPSYSFKLEWQQTFGERSERPTGLYGAIAVLF
jgi:hypothetical protein